MQSLGLGCCCELRCSVCNDIATPPTMLVTFTDVTTQTVPGNIGNCDDDGASCESLLNITHELPLLTAEQGGVVVALLALYECLPEDYDEATFCVWGESVLCGSGPASFQWEYTLAVLTYRTTGGDLRMLIVYYTVTNDLVGSCTGYELATDDILLAASASKFDCLTLNHDGTLTNCSGTPSTCWCSTPSAYNVAAAA